MGSNSEMKGLRQKVRAWYYDAGGKPRRWIALGTNQVAALKKYRQLVKESKPAIRGTIEAMLADYLAHPRAPLAPGTLVGYKIFRVHLSAVFGHMMPEELTQSQIVRYLRRCPRKSARGEIALLSMAYTAWLEDERLTFNPCFGVKIALPVSKRTRLLAALEIDAIVGKADQRLAVAIELAYSLGLRIGDLCGLRWSDFQANAETQKTGVRQAFEMTEGLRPSSTARVRCRPALPACTCRAIDAAGRSRPTRCASSG
jgi:hypothetical protein